MDGGFLCFEIKQEIRQVFIPIKRAYHGCMFAKVEAVCPAPREYSSTNRGKHAPQFIYVAVRHIGWSNLVHRPCPGVLAIQPRVSRSDLVALVHGHKDCQLRPS